MAFSDFLQSVDAGKVTQVTFAERSLDVVLRDGSTVKTVAPPEFLAANASFVPDLVKRQIRVDVKPLADPEAPSYTAIAIGLMFFGLLCFTVYRTTSGRIP